MPAFAAEVSPAPTQPMMTPTQRQVFEELLAIGLKRPVCPPGLAETLRERIATGTAEAVAAWTERSLWFGKSPLATITMCEGKLRADAETPRTDMHPATAVGIVAHRAIQLSYTHPRRPVADYVTWALDAACADEVRFAAWWDQIGPARQSDLIMQMTSKVTNFCDSWPTLDPRWHPRFEESLQAKVGRLTLSARADMILGRPQADGRQTMLLCDLKTGAIHDEHDDEAMFYALVATIRHGIAPWRSFIFSLASGTWTEPDVSAERLEHAADRVVDGVVRYVAVMTEARPPVLAAGRHCSWCPAKLTCPAAAELAG